MTQISTVSVLFLSFLVCSLCFNITILHTNDVHGHNLPWDVYYQSCLVESDWDACFDGISRRAKIVSDIRSKNPNVLLFDAGDEFQGTYFWHLFKGSQTARFMNELNYTAMCVGNHEFDGGQEKLREFIDNINFPLLSANTVPRVGSRLYGMIENYTFISIEGERIGIIGIITDSAKEIIYPDYTQDIDFTPLFSTVRNAIDMVQSEGAGIVILLSHAGADVDIELAKNVSGIDVIVGGHTHTLFSNTAPDADYPCPLVVGSPNRGKTLIVQSGFYGKYVGYLELEFFGSNLVSWSGDPIEAAPSYARDPVFDAELETLLPEIMAESGRVVGYTEIELNGDYCRSGECVLGDLATDTLVSYGSEMEASFGFINSGAVRASIGIGNITLSNVFECLPFPQNLVVFDIFVGSLADIFEHSFLQAGKGGFLQISNMKVEFYTSSSHAKRLKSLFFYNKTLDEYVHLEDDIIVRAITSDYVYQGGDGYIMKNVTWNVVDTGVSTSDAFMVYLGDHVVTSVEGGRITPIGDPVPFDLITLLLKILILFLFVCSVILGIFIFISLVAIVGFSITKLSSHFMKKNYSLKAERDFSKLAEEPFSIEQLDAESEESTLFVS